MNAEKFAELAGMVTAMVMVIAAGVYLLIKLPASSKAKRMAARVKIYPQCGERNAYDRQFCAACKASLHRAELQTST